MAKGLCPKCGATSKPGGGYCLGCHAVYMREWHVRHWEHDLEKQRERRRANPAKHTEEVRRYYFAHRDEILLRRRTDPDEIARRKRYVNSHRDLYNSIQNRHRAHRRGAVVTASEWGHIKEVFGNRCAYCGRGEVKLEQEHIVPLSRGGEHSMRNLVPACKSCNTSKKNRVIVPMWSMAVAQ